jgi:primosomal protein N' (replication factor Y)
MRRISVMTINPKLGILDYRVPDGVALAPGCVVMVPLGARVIAGVVWDEVATAHSVDAAKLREVASVIDLPPFGAAVRRLIDWTADYYLAAPGAVLKMALASGVGLEAGHIVDQFRVTGVQPAKSTPARARALEALSGQVASVNQLAKTAGVSTSVIRGLIMAGALESVEGSGPQRAAQPKANFVQPLLSPEQAEAAEMLRALVKNTAFAPVLLNGVTGSGKTEVYFEAVAEALRHNKQILLLLPEIALTQPFLARFQQRFGAAPLVWHSNLTPAARRDAYRDIATGRAQIVIGARSALFLPYPHLGLIVVDEAHETSFKQDEGVAYHARDVAVMRARFEAIPVILATATPALETRQQVNLGHYQEIILPSRFGGAILPRITAIDLTQDPPDRGRWMAPTLVRAIDETLAAGEQSLLFLNRRGFAPLTLCRTCGHRFQCPNCTAWMVEHRAIHRLQCHHCGYLMPPPRACPECQDEDSLVACGPGVERIADEVELLFPDARRAVATSDTLSSPSKVADFVAAMATGDIDIVIGTQLVTKGYHFPNLTLVGVIDADLGLQGGDLRASERSFQQISQVAGRAGRAAKPGRVFVQTYEPDAPVIQALLSGDAERFYEAELNARQAAEAPPFGRYAAVVISAHDRVEAEAFAKSIARAAPPHTHIHVYGPAPAPMAMLRGWHRFRLLVHARRSINLQSYLRAWLSTCPTPKGARVRVDIDPYNFN